MRLYYFTPLLFARMALERKRLKISRILELNDPYELLGADLTDNELRAGYEAMRNQLAMSSGTICFSKKWSLPIMWSHYADRHRGACLGFDVHGDITIPINYANDRVSFTRDMLGQHDAEQHMMRFLGTKHSAWQYEDEVRVMCALNDEEDGLFFHSFDESLVLREVLLGARCDERLLHEFEGLARAIDETISVRATRLSNATFEIIS